MGKRGPRDERKRVKEGELDRERKSATECKSE